MMWPQEDPKEIQLDVFSCGNFVADCHPLLLVGFEMSTWYSRIFFPKIIRKLSWEMTTAQRARTSAANYFKGIHSSNSATFFPRCPKMSHFFPTFLRFNKVYSLRITTTNKLRVSSIVDIELLYHTFKLNALIYRTCCTFFIQCSF